MNEVSNLIFTHEVEMGTSPEVINPGLWTRILEGGAEC